MRDFVRLAYTISFFCEYDVIKNDYNGDFSLYLLVRVLRLLQVRIILFFWLYESNSIIWNNIYEESYLHLNKG